MSEATVSCTSTREVFVPLLNEGTHVLRPTQAMALGGMRFRLIEPAGYDPDDEQWEFPPGSAVECRVEILSGSEVLVAHSRVSEPQPAGFDRD
ncbi:MAG: hypothetical protein NVSMB14_15070 [Isosphaeraceae bacterium]